MVDNNNALKHVTFDEFCADLEDTPDDYDFLAPFMGRFPNHQAIVSPPTSEDPGNLGFNWDIDSLHIVSDDIPAACPIGIYTLMDFKFTITQRNHFGIPLAGISKPVELCTIPNYRFAEFGFFGNHFKVPASAYVHV